MHLFLVRPGAPSSVLAPSSVALVTTSKALVPSSFLLLVRPGAPFGASFEMPFVVLEAIFSRSSLRSERHPEYCHQGRASGARSGEGRNNEARSKGVTSSNKCLTSSNKNQRIRSNEN